MKTMTPKQKSRIATLAVFHIVALAAPFTFTWLGFITFIILVYVTLCLGLTMCFHRMLSHQSFAARPWFRNILMLFGALAFEGDPTWWATNHRLHHQEADRKGDPHSPNDGFWWAQILWVFQDDPRWHHRELYQHYAPDLVDDPWAKFLRRNMLQINIGFILGLTALGAWLGGMHLALSMFVWGGFFRLVYVWHVTGFVDSLTHMWGYRSYNTSDNSRNLWWVALLSFGDGWHNNHHAAPNAARHGHRWWEIDITYLTIQVLKTLGLVWDVKPLAIPSEQGLPSHGST